MDLREYFERHPERYWISLAGATVFFLLSMRRAKRSSGGIGKVLAALSVVVAGAEVASLVRMRPSAGPDTPIDWSA